MSRWYFKVIADPNNFFAPLGEAIEHFYSEYEQATEELKPKRGTRLWDTSVRLPGVMEHRFGQLQEIEAIFKFLEIRYDKVYTEKKRSYLETYQRTLSERLAGEYADVEADVLVIREFIQQIALVRNLYLGLIKGLETLHFQMGHLVNLRKAMIEDATF